MARRLALALLVAAGCGPVRPCKQGTVLLSLTYDAASDSRNAPLSPKLKASWPAPPDSRSSPLPLWIETPFSAPVTAEASILLSEPDTASALRVWG